MNAVSSMTEDYLKALYGAEERGADGLGVTDLARIMNVAASTASENVRKLQQQGLLDHAPYQKAHLTERGRLAAVKIIRRHRVLETYLYARLGFDWDEVHKEAEILEHAVSDLLLERMAAALGNPTRDPHGDPIPTMEGETALDFRRCLFELLPGESGYVARISDSDGALLRYLDSLGVVLDAKLTVEETREYAGSRTVVVTPPEAWQPRQAEALADGVGPGIPKSITLGDRAVEAIWVSADRG